MLFIYLQGFKDTTALASNYNNVPNGGGNGELVPDVKPKIMKRRRSQSTVNIKGQITGGEKLHGSSVHIPKM